MSVKDGKEWETKFSEQWSETFPDYLLQRLYDQVTKYKDVSQNPSDFYAFINNKLLYIECKETESNTLNFSKFPQLDRLLELQKFKNVNGWVIIWFQKHQKVLLVSADESNRIRQDGHKSINISMLNDKLYNIIEVPCKIPRKYPVCDFSNILEVMTYDR